jgi:hypothetical protein
MIAGSFIMIKRTAYVLFCLIFLTTCGRDANPGSSQTTSNLPPMTPATATFTHQVILTPSPTQFTPIPYSSEIPDIPDTQEPLNTSALDDPSILLSNGEGSYYFLSMEGEFIRAFDGNYNEEAIILDLNFIRMAGGRLVFRSLDTDETELGPRIDCTGSWSVISIQDDYLISCEFETQLYFYDGTGELVLVHPDPELGDIYYMNQAFSPDGRFLAIWYITVEFSQTPDSGVIISNVECLFQNDSGNCTTGPYFRGADVGLMTWSPTSRMLAVSPAGGNNGEIIILNIDTGETNQILQLFTKIRGLQWSPTGEFIAYSKVYSSDNGIYLIGPQGRNPILIMETPNNYYSVVGWVGFEQ